MIKQKKHIKLIKNFKLEYPTITYLPNIIKDSDISAMFCGLISLIKTQAKSNCKQETARIYNSYYELLKMYKNAIRKMNMYKSLYIKAMSQENVRFA